MRNVVIVKDGQTLAGSPCFFLDAEDGMDEDGEQMERGDHTAGFFHSEKEARDYAVEKGWTIIE